MSWIEDNASEINEAEGEFENLQRQVCTLKAKLEKAEAALENLHWKHGHSEDCNAAHNHACDCWQASLKELAKEIRGRE